MKITIKRIISLIVIACLNVSLLVGCTTPQSEVNESTVEDPIITTVKGNKLEDKKLLYENDDDTSIVTMYLTVSTGNEDDNTNHTWEEVNSYSVYDYEEMGVERYAVNGLLQVGDENGPQEGELGYEQYVPNATVTIRGQSSSLSAQKNYKIEIQEGKGKWRDQRVINLNKHVFDAVRFRNKLCYDLLEEMPGMVALQTQFVHLYVKDETQSGDGTFVDYGLYTQVEQPNKSFLKRHGFDSNGHLYKINSFEFYRYEDEILLKNDENYDLKTFEERIEIKGDDDHSKLIAMLEDVNDESMPIDEVLDKWFEKDNLMSWLAFQILTGNIDTQSRNTLIYSPLNSNTWYFISWDCDGSFERTENRVRGRDDIGGWEQGISNYWGNVLFQRILKEESLRLELDAKINEFREILTESNIRDRVINYAKVVKPYAFGPVDSLYMSVTPEQYDTICEGLPKEIEENYRRYLETLERPMPFYIGVPEKTAEVIHFHWDNAYDFDMETVTYKFEIANNYSMNQPIYVEEGITIPDVTYTGTLPEGQYFIRVEATNESDKSQYAFDYYVSNDNGKQYGVKCFYVMPDGSIQEETYEE